MEDWVPKVELKAQLLISVPPSTTSARSSARILSQASSGCQSSAIGRWMKLLLLMHRSAVILTHSKCAEMSTELQMQSSGYILQGIVSRQVGVFLCRIDIVQLLLLWLQSRADYLQAARISFGSHQQPIDFNKTVARSLSLEILASVNGAL